MIGFLVKGLVRDRARSLFPAATVIAGVMLTVFLQTYLAGINANMNDASAAFSTGHLKVASKAASNEADLASNELALSGVGALLDEIRRWNAYYGSLIGTAYGEPFVSREEIGLRGLEQYV